MRPRSSVWRITRSQGFLGFDKPSNVLHDISGRYASVAARGTNSDKPRKISHSKPKDGSGRRIAADDAFLILR